jgi:chitinase
MTRVGLWLLSGLLLFAHKTASVTLTWDPVRGKEIVGYRIYYTDITGQKAAKAKSLNVGLITHVGVPNLLAGHTYYFAVTAVNSSGRESLPSNLVTHVIVSPK